MGFFLRQWLRAGWGKAGGESLAEHHHGCSNETREITNFIFFGMFAFLPIVNFELRQ